MAAAAMASENINGYKQPEKLMAINISNINENVSGGEIVAAWRRRGGENIAAWRRRHHESVGGVKIWRQYRRGENNP
jgi:hypothetical protein